MSILAQRILAAALLALALAPLAGCGGGTSDLKRELEEKKRQPGGRIEPLPEIKPYESFAYDPGAVRSPFQPSVAVVAPGAGGVRPDIRRNREFLEGFSLDTLRMVGTLRQGGHSFGLVQTKDGQYRPQVDEIWHSDARYRQLEQENIDLAAALRAVAHP